MKKYMKPTMNGEMFVANEYIGACWGVSCNTSSANDIEDTLRNDPLGGHNPNECGRFTQQAVVLNDGVVVGMRELGTAYGNLDCTIYTNATFTKKASQSEIANIEIGDTIYWVTVGTYEVNPWYSITSTYHHVGEVKGAIPGKPNAS